MEQIQVWRGRHGDPVPLFGPLPGVRSGDVLAYEFELSARFTPWPGRTLLERVFVLLDLDEYADAMAAGLLDTGVAIDGLRRWQRFLDRHLHANRDPQDEWTDFPPRRLRDLAALPVPLGPVVKAPD